MTVLAVSAIGADRPGIVAAVTKVLYEHGCNLEDTSMTILRGHFAMTLVVAGPAGAADLERALAPVAAQLDLLVSVREIAGDEQTAAPAAPHVVSVYGADHPGIVARVTGLLAERGANITDLSTRLQGEPGAELYVMVIEVDVPGGVDLAGDLAELARELRVEATIRAADADIL